MSANWQWPNHLRSTGSCWVHFIECGYLVAQNCQHLANANKFGHIRRINTLLGLKTPELVTPPELLGDIETGTQPTRPSRKSGRCGIASPRNTATTSRNISPACARRKRSTQRSSSAVRNCSPGAKRNGKIIRRSPATRWLCANAPNHEMHDDETTSDRTGNQGSREATGALAGTAFVNRYDHS